MARRRDKIPRGPLHHLQQRANVAINRGEHGSGSESSEESGNSRFGHQANGIYSQDAWVAQYS